MPEIRKTQELRLIQSQLSVKVNGTIHSKKKCKVNKTLHYILYEL